MNFRDLLQKKVEKAFDELGYDKKYAIVTVSNRKDLCQYQCNGCLMMAKVYKKAPLVMAKEIAEKIALDATFSKAEACPPGFINLSVSDEFLTDYINKMAKSENFMFEKYKNDTAVIDYGGANVAKSLHVGHLRSAIIGESIKRILRFEGTNAIGDVHLGDWGLQMGIVISGIIEKFGIENLKTEEDRNKNITIKVLEKTYPEKSKEAKENESVMEECHRITFELQKGSGIYFDIWEKVLEVSVKDLKKNYARLGVSFDLWKGESDVRDIMPVMIEKLKEKGLAHKDQGALVMDISREDDNPPLPPFILEKSDGAVLYSTTDLATIIDRCENINPDRIIYVVDNRQSTHFKQLFRAIEMSGMVKDDLSLTFAGFGTMNGKDGKPYKTREGGVMRLEDLINTLEEESYKKLETSLKEDTSEEEKREIARIIGIGALKFADLSNHRSKDYVFDIDKFCSFEGKTGPYVQYSAVRIKSIIEKVEQKDSLILAPEGDAQRELYLYLTEFPYAVKGAADDLAPNILIDYIYSLCVMINKFYHEYKVVSETDDVKKYSRVSALKLVYRLLTTLLSIFGIEIPERM